MLWLCPSRRQTPPLSLQRPMPQRKRISHGNCTKIKSSESLRWITETILLRRLQVSMCRARRIRIGSELKRSLLKNRFLDAVRPSRSAMRRVRTRVQLAGILLLCWQNRTMLISPYRVLDVCSSRTR